MSSGNSFSNAGILPADKMSALRFSTDNRGITFTMRLDEGGGLTLKRIWINCQKQTGPRRHGSFHHFAIDTNHT